MASDGPSNLAERGERLELSRSLVSLLRDGFRWFSERLNEEAVATGDARLSTSAAIVVSYLNGDGVRSADLARAAGMTRQHLHGVLRELQAGGIITVEPDPRSGRDRLVKTTPVGERRRQRVSHTLQRLESELAADIGQDQVTLLHALLGRAWPSDARSAEKEA